MLLPKHKSLGGKSMALTTLPTIGTGVRGLVQATEPLPLTLL